MPRNTDENTTTIPLESASKNVLQGGGERLLGDMLGLLSAALAGASQVYSNIYPTLTEFCGFIL